MRVVTTKRSLKWPSPRKCYQYLESLPYSVVVEHEERGESEQEDRESKDIEPYSQLKIATMLQEHAGGESKRFEDDGKVASEMRTMKECIEKLETENRKLEETCESLREEIPTRRTEKANKAEQDMFQHESKIQLLEMENGELKSRGHELEDEVERLKIMCRSLEDALFLLNNEEIKWESQKKSLNEKCEDLTSELECARNKLNLGKDDSETKHKARLEELEHKNQALDERCELQAQQITALTDEITYLRDMSEKILEESDASWKQSQEQIIDLVEQVEENNLDRQNKSSIIRRLGQQLMVSLKQSPPGVSTSASKKTEDSLSTRSDTSVEGTFDEGADEENKEISTKEDEVSPEEGIDETTFVSSKGSSESIEKESVKKESSNDEADTIANSAGDEYGTKETIDNQSVEETLSETDHINSLDGSSEGGDGDSDIQENQEGYSIEELTKYLEGLAKAKSATPEESLSKRKIEEEGNKETDSFFTTSKRNKVSDARLKILQGIEKSKKRWSDKLFRRKINQEKTWKVIEGTEQPSEGVQVGRLHGVWC